MGCLKNRGEIFGGIATSVNPIRYHHLVENAENEESLREWAHHHKFLNGLAPLEDQVGWLREVGFREVKLVYQKFNTALIYATK